MVLIYGKQRALQFAVVKGNATYLSSKTLRYHDSSQNIHSL